MKRIVKITRCPKCQGEGFRKEMQGIGPRKELVTSTCGYCQGTGLIERTIEIEDKPYFPHDRRAENQRKGQYS